jgi:hypothetical protein
MWVSGEVVDRLDEDLVLVMAGNFDGFFVRSKNGFEAADMKDGLGMEDNVLHLDIVLGLADDLVGAQPVWTKWGLNRT